MKKKLTLSAFILAACICTAMAEEENMDELSKKVANPLSQIWSLSFQYNYTAIGGDRVDGTEYLRTTVFQPVLPIPLGEKYMCFARPVLTMINGPTGAGITGGTPAEPVGQGTDYHTKFGDLIFPIGVGIAKPKGWSGGLGATAIFPTSNNDLLGSHQYQLGPAALAIWQNEHWLIGGLYQHWFGIADDNADSNPLVDKAHARDLNHADLQYFIIRHLPNAWQLRSSPHVRFDFERSGSNSVTLPLALGVGKMVKLGPMPVMLMMEYQQTVLKPDDISSEYTVMFQVNFIIKNPFGDL